MNPYFKTCDHPSSELLHPPKELCEKFPKVRFGSLFTFGGPINWRSNLRGTAGIPERSCGMTSDQPPEKPPEDTRSSHAKAMDRVAQITTVSFCLVLPVLLGYYVDQWLGTGFLFVIVGLLFGMAAAGVQFRKLLISLERDTKRASKKQNRSP